MRIVNGYKCEGNSVRKPVPPEDQSVELRRKYVVPETGKEYSDLWDFRLDIPGRTEIWPCIVVEGDQRTKAFASVFRYKSHCPDKKAIELTEHAIVTSERGAQSSIRGEPSLDAKIEFNLVFDSLW